MIEKNIGIRREDKNIWERRVPLIPRHVKELKEVFNIKTFLQPSEIRVFSEEEYKINGAEVMEDLSLCNFIFGIKEVPVDAFLPRKVYVFFSHTIKGQPHNMPMLKKMMELRCTLIDYERITDVTGRRLIFFGNYAGIAGMIDTLWIFGKRLREEGIKNPFENIKQTLEYKDLKDAINEIKKIGEEIEKNGVPSEIVPVVIGITGYGNVSRGVQEILSFLPVREILPEDLESIFQNPAKNIIYKVVFKEEHMVEHIQGKRFILDDYYNNPYNYRSIFYKYIPYLSILVNAIYWDPRYPKFVTKKFLKENHESLKRLKVIGDISCDIEGAVEITVKATNPGNPVFVYDPLTGEIKDGYKGRGIVVLAVDNLPCELARDSSEFFSGILKKFIPYIVNADYTENFDKLSLPPEIKRAVILYHGELTPEYKYLQKYIEKKEDK